ncbi:hypothetical protein [Legionella tucsonensis]|uniref:hypothetical protein n=1 Tax=Legionella tucsonensis TaxID=40335 RepID=UPI000AC86581|nr:hypothetical protein [Legionella tucsonensis]
MTQSNSSKTRCGSPRISWGCIATCIKCIKLYDGTLRVDGGYACHEIVLPKV